MRGLAVVQEGPFSILLPGLLDPLEGAVAYQELNHRCATRAINDNLEDSLGSVRHHLAQADAITKSLAREPVTHLLFCIFFHDAEWHACTHGAHYKRRELRTIVHVVRRPDSGCRRQNDNREARRRDTCSRGGGPLKTCRSQCKSPVGPRSPA